jgi:hypothetical protein
MSPYLFSMFAISKHNDCKHLPAHLVSFTLSSWGCHVLSRLDNFNRRKCYCVNNSLYSHYLKHSNIFILLNELAIHRVLLL